MSFSPVNASEEIIKKYKRYLNTIFKISDNRYADQFEDQLNNSTLISSGPYLDVTDAFEKGKSIKQLIESKDLSTEFIQINMPLERPLYKHQEIALEKIKADKNVVVSTGTGSGKTECFLIPILNYLLNQKENNTLNGGVRALFIYPMNALANDQIERLRSILKDTPEITYGSYTGQTKHRYKDAIIDYKTMNDGQMPNSNELISREQMKENPPHILITNYAMLEYLLVRPDDSIFFERSYADKWKYIVLDEVHVYHGSTGIEVSMLLKRLKASLLNNHIRYILTSATLGGENDDKNVSEFASNICSSEFNKTDVVRAFRLKPEMYREAELLPVSFYTEVAAMLSRGTDEKEITELITGKTRSSNNKLSIQELLYDKVLHDENYIKIRGILTAPKTINSLAKNMGWTKTQIADFVAVASKCEKGSDRLFDARYHMFLRATESVFITLNPSNMLFLTRKKEHIEPDGTVYKLFEIATCTSCHCIYIVGKEENGYLVQSNFHEDNALKSVYLLKDSISDTDEDHTLENEEIHADEYEICSRCGILYRGSGRGCPEHGKEYMVKVIKVQTNNASGSLTKCLSCENTNSFGILRMFFTGQEAVTSVIGTALFEELPSYKITKEIIKSVGDWGFGSGSDEIIEHKEKEAKQFIAFSDSRQAAAYFASYFDQTYRNILYKRLILETLKEKTYSTRGKTVDDFVEDLISVFERFGIAAKTLDLTRKEAWKAVLQEIVSNNGNTSLFSMGLIGLSVNKRNIMPNAKLNLSAEQVSTLCNVFALGMMSDAAVNYSMNLNYADKEYFTHNGVECSYSLSDANPRMFRRSFIPTKANMNNKRLDYLMRALERMGQKTDMEKGNHFLSAIWTHIFCNNNIVKPNDGSYKLDAGQIIISKPNQWYICKKCKKITPFNFECVCPGYKCDGMLINIDLEKVLEDNHYYKMYQSLDIRELRVVEHTAQLDKETAYEYQKLFKHKEIDVLSCSTTFELGVDVGSLETVFMRNMPPSPANYAQRAGRTGRSKQSAAYALTFCNKSNHDFSYFKTPERMIKGKIDPPRFVVENEKIAIRHLYASALSFFWKKYPDYFSKAVDMVEPKGNLESGFKLFSEYLESRPKDLSDYLKRFLPPLLCEQFDIENFGWLERLTGKDEENPGVMTKAIAEYEYEVGVIQDAIKQAYAADGKTDRLRERIKVYRNEEILGFLSRKNVLPKYGFPVDTVEMSIFDRSGKSKLGLQLSRDLSMAISEYAPGSQIVANGNLITSRYIKKVPNMSWKMYDYILCSCKTLNIEPHTGLIDESKLESCKQCGKTFDSISRKTFLIPSFGFEADGDKIEKPGLKKPERSFRSEVAYVGYKDKVETVEYQIGKAKIELSVSRNDEMAVINESNFFVCESCGYTDLDESLFTKTKKQKHKNSAGYWCNKEGGNILRRFSLGYRFETDVVQLKFFNPDIEKWETALSVLNGILRGACSYLDIEQSDIEGCVQYFENPLTHKPNYSLIIYDKTPGGAGHVRRLNNERTLENALIETQKLMEQCTCGGEQMDSSCYTCLRSYYNQKYHDVLSRGAVIDFMKELYIK